MLKRFSVMIPFVCCLALFVVSPAIGATIPAPPYDSNGACLECHDVASSVPTTSRVQFDVPPAVSLEKCKVCHAELPDLVPYATTYQASHYHGVDCRNCHNGVDGFYFPVPDGRPLAPGTLLQTSYGFFVSTQSLATSPAALHKIHSGTGWVEALFGDTVTGAGDGSSYMRSELGVPCASCHAAAACDACHEAPIDHGTHGSTQYPAPTIKRADGVSVLYTPSNCINDACHALADAGTAQFTPTCASCHPSNVGVHGYDGIDHVAADGTESGIACSDCHALDLESEHAAASVGECSTCHPTPRDSFDAWDRSCATGDCHTATSSAPMHGDLAAAHALPEVAATCVTCHPATDLTSLHTDASTGEVASCLVCHTAAVLTDDCTSCHFTFAEHYDLEAHTNDAMDGCQGAGCHPANTLAEAHDPYLSRYPEYENSCALCHKNTDPNRIDWSSASADCASCHTIHGDMTEIHTAPASTECVGCHESPDVRLVHGASPESSCAICHNATVDLTGKTTKCSDCHALSPVTTKHYPTASHLAVTDYGCTRCHSRDMMTEHAKSTVAVTCVQCHESKVDAFTSAWDHSCDACHPTRHGSTWGRSWPGR
ncbi:MAG: hypothetical protein CVT59_08235 [Actinobacteria bacterium HGW-Actinobacteria-1]|jgi:hypothetical protein|nr:MAG: hypothetical protein CVT59_08235 [Actinobacteria bacterium HGW-Actinobacteria-1]